MVKLDLTVLRYLSRDDFRVLTALEMGMKNHDLVSTQLINSLAALKRGDVVKAIQELHKNKLVYHESRPYDGYRLTYHGYDFLAVKTHVKRNNLVSIGHQIGTGKESDVFLGEDGSGAAVAVKFHRLGRTSFRTIKRNRDYHQGRTHASWLYLSRLAALKEFAYMKALYEHGFPVPRPVDVNRHVVVMEFLKGYTTLYHVHELKKPGKVYSTLMNLLVALADVGLIHGDFNEFNLMVDENDNVILIDFPQMVSIDHPNAEMYFNRDVDGVRNFFKKRFGFHASEYPVLGKDTFRKMSLDKEIQASGFSKQHETDLDELTTMQKQQREEDKKKNDENNEELGDDRDDSDDSDEGDGNDDDDDKDDHDNNGEEDTNGRPVVMKDLAKSSSSSSPAAAAKDESSMPLESKLEKLHFEVGSDDELDEDGDDEGDEDQNDRNEQKDRIDSHHNNNPDNADGDDGDDDDDDGPPGETRRERKERLQRKAEAKLKAAKEAAAAASSSSAAAHSNTASVNNDNELDDAERRERIIRQRVKAQLDRKRLRERTHAKNAFKQQARKTLAQQTRHWAEDM